MIHVYGGDNPNELYHHGILGQKWGVRRFQNYDGTRIAKSQIKTAQTFQKKRNKEAKKGIDRTELTKERTIPQGTKIYRVSVSKDEKLEGSKYVTYLDVDRNHYKSGWIRQTGKSDKAYEYEYELNKELKIPSRQEQQKVINEVVKSNGKYLNEAIKGWVNQIIPEGSWEYYETEDYYKGGVKGFTKDVLKNFKNKTPEEAAFQVSQSLGLAPNVKKEVIDRLQKKGFNAMVDEASVGGQNGFGKESYDPLIIFDASVLTQKNISNISKREEESAYKKDRQYINRLDKGSAKWSAI